MIIFGLILTSFELSSILEAAGAVLTIGSSLKSNHHWKIKLAQIRETLCTRESVIFGFIFLVL